VTTGARTLALIMCVCPVSVSSFPPGTADAIYWLLTLSAGEHAARARIAWAKEALELLDGPAADQPR